MRGIAIMSGVCIITAWIPCRGLINWKDLTDEEIREIKNERCNNIK